MAIGATVKLEPGTLKTPIHLARKVRNRLRRKAPAPPPQQPPALIVPMAPPARLWEEHVSRDARLFADRLQLLSLVKKECIFVEVGVGVGDFSRYILSMLRPTRFDAIDIFDLHEMPELWGRPTSATFGDLTHEQYYRNQFRAQIEAGTVRVLGGDSVKRLKEYADASVDVIYIDANHLYEFVAAELRESARIVKDDGLIILNDYIMYDHRTQADYGVVQAANEFIVENGWEVIGFALQDQMFCDIAIRRKR